MKTNKFILPLLSIVFLFQIACFAQEPPENPNIATSELKIAGLKDRVTIRRDERGIPYIEARNETDLYFAQGFATAQDRLWQMDLFRRVPRGETAEIFGSATLEEDKRWRKFGFARVAEETIENASPSARAILEAYARGVNAYIATLNEQNLPPEFKILQYRPREWRPADSIVVSKIFADALSNTWRQDLLKASLQNLPADKRAQIFEVSTRDDVLLVGKDNAIALNQINKHKQDKQDKLNSFTSCSSCPFMFDSLAQIESARRNSLQRIGFYAENLAASNNWVVSGKRTADGQPLLANDPHLRAGAPPIWHLVNLSAPELHVAGVTAPGIAGVIIGHNDKIAWGVTNVGPDVQDLYLETFDPNNPRRYRTPNGWADAIVRREEIKVRKSPISPDTTSQFLDVTETRNGTIVFEENEKRYALKWTALDSNNTDVEAFSALSKARNWQDFQNSLKLYGNAMQNFVYADADGNIGWIAAGKVPKRKTGDGSLPYDGATNDGTWIGTIPFDELPQLFNPPTGIIVTANQRIVGQTYKHQELARAYDSPFRARRILDLLQANPKLTVDNFREIQFDVLNQPLARFAREVASQKAGSDDTLKLLAGWDGRMLADSKAALVANEVRSVFRARILNANLNTENFPTGLLSAFLDRLIIEKPKSWLPKEFADYAALLKACDAEARAGLTKRLGADESKWTWGAANKINLAHPLAGVPFIGAQFAIEPLAQNGARDTPNVGAAVSMRFIAAPGNWDATRFVLPSGESGLPSSAHYKDQVDFWYKGNTPVFPFSQTAVRNATKEKLLLAPQ